MNLVPGSHHARTLVILAPPSADVSSFPQISHDRSRHEFLLAELQRFRGRIYCDEHNLRPDDLSQDGRHIQSADYCSWHLMSISESGEVGSCIRGCVYSPGVEFSNLIVSHSALARSADWGHDLAAAIESEIGSARRRQVQFAEVGGWAIERALRCTTEAIRMLVTIYALGDLLGGVAGIATANVRHHSASILRRMGAKPLIAGGRELPAYYEPQYSSELEILKFDSTRPNSRYWSHVQESCAALRRAVVISASPAVARQPQHAERQTRTARGWYCDSPMLPAQPSLV